MSSLITQSGIPGASAAAGIMSKLRSIGIGDVQLFYDADIKPNGMWAVVQVQNRTSSLILPSNYMENNVRPYILWWCKTNDGHFRLPNDQDLSDIVAVVQRAEVNWKNDGNDMADRLDQQAQKKDEDHQAKFKQKIKDIAPAMKRAVKKELG